MPKVRFIRHGESKGNAGLRTSFPNEIQLTKNGQRQAKCIVHSFCKYRPPSLIITSKYIRTLNTAQPTIKRYPKAHHTNDWPVHEFTYLSPYKVAHTTVQDRRHLVDAYWKRSEPYYVDGEGAESFIDFIRRVSHVLEILRDSHEDFIVVFTHGQFIAAAQWLLKVAPIWIDHDSMKQSGEVGLTWIDGDSMKQFRCFLEHNQVPTGAILPMQLDREKGKVEDMIISHLTPVKGERLLDKWLHFVKEVWRFITCESFKLRSILI